MFIINDFKFYINREMVFKSIECYKNSKAYDITCKVYEKLLNIIKELQEPKAVFKFGNKINKFDIAYVKNCKEIVYCVLTLGQSISDKSDYYFKNNEYLEGMVFDAMADELLNEYAAQLFKKVCIEAKKRNLGLTCKLSPGNEGFPIERQKDILDILTQNIKLNIDVTEGFMLRPPKSVSFIFGADKNLGIPLNDNECSRCKSLSCKMRKEPYIDKNDKSTVNLTVIYKKNQINIKAPKNKSILHILNDNNIKLSSPCGGNGTCGKCKVKVVKGSVVKCINNSILGEKLIKQGWCLACSSFLRDDCSILLNFEKKDYDILDTYDFSDFKIKSLYKCIEIFIDTDKLNGNSFTDYINLKLKSNYTFTLEALRKLSTILNQFKGNINLLVDNDKVADVSKDKIKVYGIAVDIGTTTIVLNLIDLITGHKIKSCSLLNSQKQFGLDVISRINSSNEGNLKLLNKCIKNDLIKGIKQICSDADVNLQQIYNVTAAGNTTMLYLLLNLNPEQLGVSPFNTVTTSLLEYKFDEIFRDELLHCNVTIMPGVSAYVGADIAAGMLKCNFDTLEKNCILIDIGTNGEMAIGNKNRILCLSAAAGPAFEGANISCGTGSIKGAVNSVEIKNGIVSFKTIGDEVPEGICGSGVIDITAQCLKNSIIDKTGLFNIDKYPERYIKIAQKDNDGDIVFTQKDVREVQLAKSAIRSGIEILLKKFGKSYDDIDTVFIAGGFGYHINIENAAVIGLIPQQLKNKVKCVGNTSLGGAVKYLLNKESKNNLKNIIDKTEYIALSSEKNFNDIFTDNMMF